MRSVFVACCIAALVSPLCASPISDARTTIQGAYQRRDTAWSRKNSAAFLAEMSPDYRLIYKGRPFSRATVARQTRSGFSVYKTTKRQTTLTHFTLGKGQATADVREKISATLMRPRTKKSMRVDSVGTTRDTWVTRGGKWRLKQSKVLSLSAIVDGKK